MTRVKNILVNDVEVFEEELIKELINNQISYVKIENEFHFLDHIYRIYDLERIAKIYSSFSKGIHILDLSNYIVNFEDTVLPISSISKSLDVINCYVPENNVESDEYLCKEYNFSKINKRLIKQQNRQVNKIVNKK